MLKFLSKWKHSVFAWQWQKEHNGTAEEGLEEKRNINIYSVTEAVQPYCIQCNSTENGWQILDSTLICPTKPTEIYFLYAFHRYCRFNIDIHSATLQAGAKQELAIIHVGESSLMPCGRFLFHTRANSKQKHTSPVRAISSCHSYKTSPKGRLAGSCYIAQRQKTVDFDGWLFHLCTT